MPILSAESGPSNARKDATAMKVIISLEDADGLRCVDILEDGDGGFHFKEFRRDPEDGGRWTLVADYAAHSYSSRNEALLAAGEAISWLAASRSA
jgi:hypothetical protein